VALASEVTRPDAPALDDMVLARPMFEEITEDAIDDAMFEGAVVEV
jgi:hypothetical protein